MSGSGKRCFTYLLLVLFTVCQTGLVLAATGGTAHAATTTGGNVSGSRFNDVSAGDFNQAYINYLGQRGIISGMGDGSFRPSEGLTRAQAAVVIARAMNLNTSATKDSGFKDVASSHWAAAYIAAAVKAGYLKGNPDGTYKPDEKLSRAQATSLVLRLSKQADSGVELPQLSDMDQNHWAARSIAIGLDAGMIQLKGENTIEPETPMSRGELARALALLLTRDPELASRKLYGTLIVKTGDVNLSRSGSIDSKKVTGSTPVGTGDQIEVEKNGEAVINYPDGSSILLKYNSTVVIKEAQGRAYIKADGSPGTAVDNLEVELKNGKLFGGLASLWKTTGSTTTSSLKNDNSKLASLDSKHDLLAAGEKETPWYKTAEKKKVKVKVDMPWGVAAIRGSFWGNVVNTNGCGMTLLEGEGSLSAGGQNQNLSPGQSSGTGSDGGAPSAPAPMSPNEQRDWAQQRDWVQDTAQEMQGNQEAGQQDGTEPGQQDNPADNLLGALDTALNRADQVAASIPSGSTPGSSSGGSSGGGGSSSGGAITVGSIPSSVLLPVQVLNPLGSPVPGSASCSFTISPANAVISQSSSGTDVVDLILSGGGTASRCGSLITKGTTGTEVITLTITAPGYTSLTQSISITVLPLLGLIPEQEIRGYTTPVSMEIYDSFDDLWDIEESGISLQVIDSLTGQPANDNMGIPVGTIVVNPADVADSTINFDLNVSLAEGKYGVVVSDASGPRGMALLPILHSFALDEVILCYGLAPGRNLMPNDYLYFFFNDALDPASLNIPDLEPGGGAVSIDILATDGSDYTASFADLGLGDFTTSFSVSDLSDNPYIQGNVELSPDGKMLAIGLTGNPGEVGNFTLASGSFIPSALVTNSSGTELDNTPLQTTSAGVTAPALGSTHQTLACVTGTAISNQPINAVGVQIWYDSDGSWYYLQPDGEGGWTFDEGEYAIAATATIADWSAWSLTLEAAQQAAIIDSEPLGCNIDVFMSLGNVGSTLRYVSSFAIDTSAPELAPGYPTDPPDSPGDLTPWPVADNLVMYFIDEVTAVPGKHIFIKRGSDDSIFADILAASANVNITTSWGESTVTIDPPANMGVGTQYYVQIDTGAFVDLAGNPYAGINDTTTWNFGTNMP